MSAVTLFVCLLSATAAGMVRQSGTLIGPPSPSMVHVQVPEGPDHNNRFGEAVAWIGENEGIAVGCSGFERKGAVFFLKPEDGSARVRSLGETTGEYFGTRIVPCGDVDKDGLRDVAVVTLARLPDRPDYDRYYSIVSSGSGRRLYSSKRERADASGDLCAIADRDGDGIEEIAIGLQSNRENHEDLRIGVNSGADGHRLAEWTIPGSRGYGVARIFQTGDLDGDGVPDLVVGCAAGHPCPGQVFLISAKAGTVIRSFTDEDKRAEFSSPAIGSDLDGDGSPDLVVGTPNWCLVEAFSSKTGKTLWKSTGDCSSDSAGANSGGFADVVVSIGDVDGDGVEDFLVSDGDYKTLQGRAWVVSGRTGKFVRAIEGDGELCHFGSPISVARASTRAAPTCVVIGSQVEAWDISGRVGLFALPSLKMKWLVTLDDVVGKH